ncbi:sigma-70 family RNA polymerase sigma factor [Thermopirellula anaerolimosa]|jgi:RNA polymerase sigma-70 factor (ECF subfamily)
MSQGKYFVVTQYAKALIQAKARQLCRRRDFRPSEQEDIEQELWLAVLEKAERFDPARARLETFLDRVVSRAAAMLLRSRKRRKRGNGVLPLSLESDFTSTGEGLKPLSETVFLADVARRLGTQSADPVERLEQTEAIECALAQMPERLRDICRRLMTGTVASVARELGISRYQVRKALEEARPYFEEAGLQNF